MDHNNHKKKKEVGISGRSRYVDIRKGPWTMEEDLMLVNYIATHGEGVWNTLAKAAGLKRTGKSCRLRWLNYLRPDVRRGNITPEEQLLIMKLHTKWGNRWSKIAKHLPGRTDNEIKNFWRTKMHKLIKQSNNDNINNFIINSNNSCSSSNSIIFGAGSIDNPNHLPSLINNNITPITTATTTTTIDHNHLINSPTQILGLDLDLDFRTNQLSISPPTRSSLSFSRSTNQLSVTPSTRSSLSLSLSRSCSRSAAPDSYSSSSSYPHDQQVPTIDGSATFGTVGANSVLCGGGGGNSMAAASGVSRMGTVVVDGYSSGSNAIITSPPSFHNSFSRDCRPSPPSFHNSFSRKPPAATSASTTVVESTGNCWNNFEELWPTHFFDGDLIYTHSQSHTSSIKS